MCARVCLCAFDFLVDVWLCGLQHVLALLRLGNHDADVFFKFKQVLIDNWCSTT